MMLILSFLCAGFLLFILIVWRCYNKLIVLRHQIDNALSSTDALFIKRRDLIPNLMATVQQYMDFEKETLIKITALREQTSANVADHETEAKAVLHTLKVKAENYPELQASQEFETLMYSMNEIEEQISAGRRFISASITDYNNHIKMFPDVLVAKLCGFKAYEWQKATDEQRQAVQAKDIFKHSS